MSVGNHGVWKIFKYMSCSALLQVFFLFPLRLQLSCVHTGRWTRSPLLASPLSAPAGGAIQDGSVRPVLSPVTRRDALSARTSITSVSCASPPRAVPLTLAVTHTCHSSGLITPPSTGSVTNGESSERTWSVPELFLNNS